MSNTELKVTINDSNTLFIEMDGAIIADCAAFDRVRGFWNKLTEQWLPAKGFTPKKVKANPELVLQFLANSGTPMVASVEIVF